MLNLKTYSKINVKEQSILLLFQHCDEVIPREYPVMKGIKSHVLAEMTGEKVKVTSNNSTVKCDKSPMQVNNYS